MLQDASLAELKSQHARAERSGPGVLQFSRELSELMVQASRCPGQVAREFEESDVDDSAIRDESTQDVDSQSHCRE